MNRMLKALAVAIGAVIALAAFSGSVWAAEFHSEVAHTQISGSQVGTDVFTVNAGTVKCTEAKYSGTQTSGVTSSEIKVTPSYSGCTAFGFVNATVDVNGCPKLFTANLNPILHLICFENPITVTAFNCWVKISSQTIGLGITYTNEGAGATRDIKVSENISGITYTQESKSFPGCTNGTFTNGTYTGAATYKGANTAGTQVGIWWG
jgi:hypothetical protein